MAVPYRSRAPVPPSALLALASAGIGAALVLALGWHWTGAIGRLAFLGVIARAVAIGLLLSWIVGRLHISRPRVVGAVAILATLGAVTGSHIWEFRQERAGIVDRAEKIRATSLSAGTPATLVESDYRDRVDAATFWAYLQGEFGLGDEANGKDGIAAMFGGGAGITVYLLELLAGLFFAALLPTGRASEPACSHCGAWLELNRTAELAFGSLRIILKSIHTGDTSIAGEWLKPPDTRERTLLSLLTCRRPHNEAGGVLRIHEEYFDRRSKYLLDRHRMDLALDADEYRALAAALESVESKLTENIKPKAEVHA